MTRPTMNATLMDVARLMARRSTCTRAQVGCVVALDGRVLTTGYNGAPSGLPHCDHTCRCLPSDAHHVGVDGELCLENRSAGCTVAVHAEANAIAFAAKNGIALLGSTIYTTLSPCVPCAQLIINAGVRHFVCEALYRDQRGLELLLLAGLIPIPVC